VRGKRKSVYRKNKTWGGPWSDREEKNTRIIVKERDNTIIWKKNEMKRLLNQKGTGKKRTTKKREVISLHGSGKGNKTPLNHGKRNHCHRNHIKTTSPKRTEKPQNHTHNDSSTVEKTNLRLPAAHGEKGDYQRSGKGNNYKRVELCRVSIAAAKSMK